MPAGLPTGIIQTMYQYDVQQLPRAERMVTTGVQPQQRITGQLAEPTQLGVKSPQSTAVQPQTVAPTQTVARPQQVVRTQPSTQPQQTGQLQRAVQPQQTGQLQQAVQPQQTGQLQQAVQPQQVIQPQRSVQSQQPATVQSLGTVRGAQQLPASVKQVPAWSQQLPVGTLPRQLGSYGVESRFGTGGQGNEVALGVAQQPIQAQGLRGGTIVGERIPAVSGVRGQSQTAAAGLQRGGGIQTWQPTVGHGGLVGYQEPALGQRVSPFAHEAPTFGQQAAGGGQFVGSLGQHGRATGVQQAAGSTQQAALGSQQSMQAMNPQFGQQELDKSSANQRQYLSEIPDVDVFETPDTVTIYADVPGSKDEELEILANDNSITLLATRDEEFEEDADLILQERPTEFKRSIALPAVADIDAAEATHEDGTCKITLPKREEARQKRIGFQ